MVLSVCEVETLLDSRDARVDAIELNIHLCQLNGVLGNSALDVPDTNGQIIQAKRDPVLRGSNVAKMFQDEVFCFRGRARMSWASRFQSNKL